MSVRLLSFARAAPIRRWVDASGGTRLSYRPVHLNTLTSDVETVPLKARTY